MTTVTNWSTLPAADAGGGIVKRQIPGKGATLVRVEIPAGFKGSRHSHPHEQFVEVLAGTGTLESEAGTIKFGPGSNFHFPKDAWHAASFDTATVLVEINLGA